MCTAVTVFHLPYLNNGAVFFCEPARVCLELASLWCWLNRCRFVVVIALYLGDYFSLDIVLIYMDAFLWNIVTSPLFLLVACLFVAWAADAHAKCHERTANGYSACTWSWIVSLVGFVLCCGFCRISCRVSVRQWSHSMWLGIAALVWHHVFSCVFVAP